MAIPPIPARSQPPPSTEVPAYLIVPNAIPASSANPQTAGGPIPPIPPRSAPAPSLEVPAYLIVPDAKPASGAPLPPGTPNPPPTSLPDVQ
jgi:hypothetical protein